MRIDIRPSPKQEEGYKLLLDDKTEFIGYGGAAYTGKSWLGAEWILLQCLRYASTRWFIGRNDLVRLEASVVRKLYEVMKYHGIPQDIIRHDAQKHILYFQNGSTVDLLDLKFYPQKDPMYERFGSLEYTGGWLEECGEVNYMAFEVLKSRTGRAMNAEYGLLGKIFLTFNPKRNWLYHTFYLPHTSNELEEGYGLILGMPEDNIYGDPNYITKHLDTLKNPILLKRLRLGLWEYDDEPDQLIKYEWLVAAEKIDIQRGIKILGVDVAREGNDKTIIILREGNRASTSWECKGTKGQDVAGELYKIAIDHGVTADNIRIDSIGIGASAIDHMESLYGYKCKSIVAGSSPTGQLKNENIFKNYRAEMYWNLRNMLEAGEISMNHDISGRTILYEDCAAIKYFTPDDKTTQIESKKDIKKRIGRSTDYSDAMAFCFAPLHQLPSAGVW